MDIETRLTRMYEQLELELMRSIARRVRDYQEISGSIEWELQMLAEIGRLTEENRRTLARTLSDGDEELQKLLYSAMEAALEEVEPLFQKAADAGILHDAVRPEFSRRLQTAYSSYLAHAEDTLNLTNTTMLHSAEQAYRNIIDRTTAKLFTGQTSRVEALKQTIREFAQMGLPALTDRAGRKWSPEAYVNMVIRSTTNNVSRETRFARMDDWGSDLFYISAHSGARPLCAPYQGMLVSKSGGSGIVEDLAGNKIRFIPLSSTSFGEKAGIFGINCGHFPIVFIPGISARYNLPTEEMTRENDRVYKESQQQRGLERRIRKIKGEIDIYDKSGMHDLIPGAQDKLKAANARMEAFIDRTGRTRRRDREQIY